MYHTLMSKGLGKLQRAIVGLLDVTLEGEVYTKGRILTTNELLDELRARGLVKEDIPRKTAMFAVRRACLSLLNRGILEGEYIIDCNYPWANVASWHLSEPEKHDSTD